MSTMIVAPILFIVVNIAVYSVYSKLILEKPILFNDILHYSLVAIIATKISLMSMYVMGMRL